jgi:beta-glucanase (GH16 family)
VYHRLSHQIAAGMAWLVFGLGAARADTLWAPSFVDEFDGSAVDWTHWNSAYSTGDPVIANNELQAYVPEACTVANSMLHITASRQQHQYGSAMMNYTSGELTTRGYFQQLYGKFEMRARMPAGQGLFPALWLVSSDSSHSEIDIMENLGQDPSKIYFTVHGNSPAGPVSEQGSYTAPTFSTTYFHNYALDWEPGLITWSVDGVTTFQSALSPDVPMHLVVNLAVGGNWPNAPDQTTVFPASYDIDYIHAYQTVPEPSILGLAILTALGLYRRAR